MAQGLQGFLSSPKTFHISCACGEELEQVRSWKKELLEPVILISNRGRERHVNDRGCVSFIQPADYVTFCSSFFFKTTQRHGVLVEANNSLLGWKRVDETDRRSFNRECFQLKERMPLNLCQASTSGNSQDDGSSSSDPQFSALKIEQLQVELDRAIRLEEYDAAAQIRDRLRLLQEDDEAAVLAQNALFYRAFATADLRLMRRVWVNGDHASCLHPGANCISGYELVMASWEAVLESARDFRISLEDVHIHTNGSMAVVTCVEVIRAAGSSGRIAATNIFEKRDNEWRMFVHHGSQVPFVG